MAVLRGKYFRRCISSSVEFAQMRNQHKVFTLLAKKNRGDKKHSAIVSWRAKTLRSLTALSAADNTCFIAAAKVKMEQKKKGMGPSVFLCMHV